MLRRKWRSTATLLFWHLEPISVQLGGAGMIVNLYNRLMLAIAIAARVSDRLVLQF